MKFVLDGDTLNATMIRLADPSVPAWESKDTFKIVVKAKQISQLHNP